MARKTKRSRKRNTEEQESVTPRKRNRKAKLQATVATKLSKKPKAVKLANLDYDPSIFRTLHTGNIVDKFFSNKGGVPKACNFIVIGDPGVGKTTVGLDILADVQNTSNAKVLFISGEMNEVDMYEYMERFPKFGQIDIIFLADYVDENPKLVIEEMLQNGYDVVLGDSFVEIQDTVKEACYMTTSQSEKWLIDLMVQHNKGNNKRKAYTTFLMIQQVTKGGNFVGSNKLKHNTTGMLEIRFSGGENSLLRYMEFTKNRRGSSMKKLWFSMNKPNDINWNMEKWQLDEDSRKRLDAELEGLAKEAEDFEKLLSTTTEPVTDNTQTPVTDEAEALINANLEEEEEEDEN
jgi:predicted ATP-dependent serine protease